jgi:hypothetical protein
MRVRILSGHRAGCEQDLPQVEAEVAIATGYAELAPEPRVEPATVEDAPAEDPPPADPSTEDPPTPDPPSE